MLKAIALLAGAMAACASPPGPLTPSRSSPCVREGKALDFLRGITHEWVRDSSLRAALEWRTAANEEPAIADAGICQQAVEELTGWGGHAQAPDSVGVLKVGNRYTAVRVDGLNIVMVLNEAGHQIYAGVLE
jgi:hypothetical protein